MKKLLSIISIFVLFVTLSACKKDHTCNCTADFLGVSISADTTLSDLSKKDAKSKCEGFSESGVVCELK